MGQSILLIVSETELRYLGEGRLEELRHYKSKVSGGIVEAR